MELQAVEGSWLTIGSTGVMLVPGGGGESSRYSCSISSMSAPICKFDILRISSSVILAVLLDYEGFFRVAFYKETGNDDVRMFSKWKKRMMY